MRSRVACAVVAGCLAAPSAALAHGDPSSHYLETEPLYPGFANRPSQQVELGLLGVLEAARRDGYPIKVSIVGSVDDVVEDPAIVDDPQGYAEQVAGTLGGPNVKAPIVIVTQQGVGVAGVQTAPGGDARPLTAADARQATAGLPSLRQADGDRLAATAERVVRQLAREGGHPLPADIPPAEVLAPSGEDGGGSGPGFLLPAVLFATVFLGAWLFYELRTRAAARRGGAGAPRSLPSDEATSPRAT